MKINYDRVILKFKAKRDLSNKDYEKIIDKLTKTIAFDSFVQCRENVTNTLSLLGWKLLSIKKDDEILIECFKFDSDSFVQILGDFFEKV